MAEFIFQESGPLGLAMKDLDWYVAPGDKITIPALVANRGTDEIYVELSVQGVPVEWVTIDNPVIRLVPTEKREIALTISPLPYPQSRAGEYLVAIHAVIQKQPEITVKVQDTLTVAANQPEGQIALLMGSLQYEVAPGGNLVVPIQLVNRSLEADNFLITVLGLAPEWVSTSTTNIRLAPAEGKEIQFDINIPRGSRPIAGRNSFSVQVTSQSRPYQKADVKCILNVAVFSQFSASLPIATIQAGETSSLTVKNEGNTIETFKIGFHNQLNQLIFEKTVNVPKEKSDPKNPEMQVEFLEITGKESLNVGAGETAKFEFRVRPRNRKFVGGETPFPFIASIQSQSNKQEKSLEGQNISKAYLPVWVFAAIVVFLLICCCSVTFFFKGNRQGTAATAATQTASVNQTQAVINGGEDTDGDGLANTDETQRGTDPNNPDTDGDELKDGEEVITYLTDPLKPDSDSDGLSDGEEVLRQKTNPILPDTDGDTLTDGNEVQIKTNPLQPDTDGDGLKDGDEIRVGTDPLKPDTDNDGLLDGQENQTCPNFLNPDSDNDGIVDGKDPNPCDATNPSLTANAPTAVPPTTIPPTTIPPTGVPPTAIPPTAPAGATATTAPQAPNLSGTMVFESNRDGNSEIYSLNVANFAQTRLTNNAAVDMEPALSPNSQQMAYVSNSSGNNEIYLVGTDRRAPINLTNNPADEQDPCWSPDGNWIAFTTNRDGNPEIYIMKKDGTEVRNLTNNPASDSDSTWFSGPGALSADEWIAFTTNRDGNNEIYRVRSDGSELLNLTQNPANDYSPGGYGSSLAFVSERGGNPDIYIIKMDAKTMDATNITNSPSQDLDPAFGTNSNWIAFASDRGGNLDIWVIQTNGQGAYNMTNTPAQDRRPSWR